MNSQVAKNAKKRVFVGLSGGVDSSVSAALLLRAGYEVIGVFIKVWQPDWIECTWQEDRREAMRAAAHLGIPFLTLDLEAEYKKGVIDYMIAEYKAGRTPNPDVMCNREVKFGAFARWAREQGADHIATGHYARTKDLNGTTALLTGLDNNKDQSYFLWTLNQRDLPAVLFPVGHLQKSEVRRLARQFGLPNAEKKDSQGLCFIGKLDFKEFLSKYLATKPGNVLDESGTVIGNHPGAELFTIGERHGFTITAKTPHDKAYFVIDKDVDQNTLTVSSEIGTTQSSTKSVILSRVNWTSGQAPEILADGAEFNLEARARYRQTLFKVRLSKVGLTSVEVEFESAQEYITPGQSLVIYDGETCLGGGIIWR